MDITRRRFAGSALGAGIPLAVESRAEPPPTPGLRREGMRKEFPSNSLTDVLSVITALPGERYRCPQLSRQMAIAKFADPAPLEDLMQWVLRCGSIGSDPSQIAIAHSVRKS